MCLSTTDKRDNDQQKEKSSPKADASRHRRILDFRVQNSVIFRRKTGEIGHQISN